MFTQKSRGWLTLDLTQIVARFPVPLAISVAFAIIANLEIADALDLPSFRWERPSQGVITLDQVYSALASGFFASGAAHLFAEGRRWGRPAGVVLALASAVVVGLICWNMRTLDVQFLFLLPALILAVTVAGYLRRGVNGNALWMFNARLALATLTAVLAMVIFGAGLSAIIESVSYLFGVRIDSDAHEHIWMTGATLIAPVVGLSMVSRDLDEGFDPTDHPGLLVNSISRLLNYLLIPLALVYIVILHLYAGKMLLEWELPRGQVGIMVVVFSIGGTAIWMVASPWRNSGSALVRFFERYYFWFLIVPLILLSIGTWRRISDYGVTPDRYGLVAVGLWIAVLIISFTIVSRSGSLRLMLGSLAIVLAVSAFGPWGARSISADSQFTRLIALMEKQGYFQQGVLTIPASIDADISKEGASIVSYLTFNGHIGKLEPHFSGRPDNPFDGEKEYVRFDEVASLLKFSYQPNDDRNYRVNFSADGPFVTELSSDTLFSGPHTIKKEVQPADRGSAVPSIFHDGEKVNISYQDHHWSFDIKTLINEALEAERDDKSEALVLPLESDQGAGRLVLIWVSGYVDDDEVDSFTGTANLFLPVGSP